MRRVVAVLLAGALLAACSGGDDDATSSKPVRIGRAGSVEVDSPTSVTVGAPLTAYAVSYRIEETDGDEVRTTSAELLVVRPYRSRLETLDEDGARVALRVVDFARTDQVKPGEDAKAFMPVPGPSPDDVRSDLLGPADGEVREVAGRACQVHHFGAPILAGRIIDGDTTDTCIDADGIVLEEVVTAEDEITSRWLATDVDTEPVVDDADFVIAGAEVVPAAEGGGSVQEVEPDSMPPGTFYVLDAPPAGFTHRGRYAVVPPQDARPDDEKTRARVIAGVADVYERGIDVVVVEQGGTLGQVAPFGAEPDKPTIDSFDNVPGVADAGPTIHGGEVRVLVPPGRYVKVSGTLPIDDLIAITKRLQGVPGTQLVYEND
jgi:hypothetical protein